MRVKLPSVALACDRTGVSDRAAAIIVNAVLEDAGVLSKANATMTIDRMKIRRARKAQRELCMAKTTKKPAIIGLFFDGRKDQTLIYETTTNKRRRITEEHISLVTEPGSQYIGHVVPESGSASNIKASILLFLQQNFNLNGLIAVGADGTAVNTGAKNGVIRLLEKELNRPLQWLICLFHFNELPLRHLIKEIDGETSGPRGHKGPIGQKLESCENLPVENFKRIKSDLPQLDGNRSDLSTDQQYLLDIVQSVETGNVSASLASRNPGKLSHARWLTTANRIMRLYVATKVPDENLCLLTTYISKVYAPFWFRVKLQPSCYDGSRHLFKLIQSCSILPEKVQKIIYPVIQRNGFFAHPENILLSMLTDEDPLYKQLAIRRILKARSKGRQTIRDFNIPTIRFDAKHYSDMISWIEVSTTEPPMTINMHMNLDLISNLSPSDFPLLPCNTQAVERCVRLVTEASAAVCGQSNRDGFIKNRVQSRQVLPYCEKKSDYFKNRNE
ncbi:hypothetical protein RI129_003240 [Pyrocoelia pectoralis]|uniref:Uncharacterized protein n=1 Tax=Pyrocoelia pectoralis TaxID=417401 RepID=A0AAN7VQ02_9COLE